MLNINKVGIIFLASTVLIAVGCSKDEDVVEPVVETTTTPVTTTPAYNVPTTYAFVDGTNVSNVSFGGQKQRLEMLSEMVTVMKTGNTVGTAVSATTLKDMYANNGYSWIDNNVPQLGMLGSSKQLKSKTAAGDAGVIAMFEGYMDNLASISNGSTTNTTDTYGNAGVWTNGTKSYLMDGNGYEYTQLIEKGLMCAVFMNQMTNNYLQAVVSDDNLTVIPGENYTVMQHHWDEAYGYFTSEVDFPTNGTNRFWGKYADGREGVLSSATKIATAFRTGRAAIDNSDYTTRNAQITIILTEMEKVCAGTAIHYLNEAKGNVTDGTLKNHQLSEARAFVNGLKYSQKTIDGSGISVADINTALTYFENFETVSIAGLNSAIDLIAMETGLTNVKASL
jgi:hypothetical protein